jgi:hypothetical protein
MTASKEVVVRRAIAAATQAGRPRYARRPRRRGEPRLVIPAGLALIATGLICALAVHIHSRIVNVQTAGIIVMGLGLAWLWIPLPHKRVMLRRQFDRTMRYLAWDPAEDRAVRCSLDELLESCANEDDDRGGG